jgi:hypothetical protein
MSSAALSSWPSFKDKGAPENIIENHFMSEYSHQRKPGDF